MSAPRHRCALALLLLLAAFGSACGYHLQGHLNALPPNLRVVAVLPFKNETRAPHLSQTITAAVAQELVQQARYRVQPIAAGADAVLRGTVVSLVLTPVTSDPTTGHATMVEVRMRFSATLIDLHTHKTLFQNDDMVFHDQYQISQQLQDFFEEDQSAYQRMSQTVARTLVSNILENF